MEDDEEIQSSTPNGRIAVTVAAAAPPSLTLALPIQNQKTPGTGGGREDCWSEGATGVLIDAWGERYLELSRGNLKQKHWKDVADIVSSREDYTKTPKTDIQCKNRIDTVKKKYKTEKAKIASGGGPSKWRFFDRLDQLIGPTAKMINSSTPPPDDHMSYPMGIPVGNVRSSSERFQPTRQNLKLPRPRPLVDSDDESEPEEENSADSSDGLPPQSYNKRPRIPREQPRMVNNNNNNTNVSAVLRNKRNDASAGNKEETSWGNSMREVTRAIIKFGEAYEQAETTKLQQLVEMEKQRMKFAKDLELQRMQYFMKTQLELSQLKNTRRAAGNNTSSSNHHGINNNNDANNNNNNNSDSSN